MNQELKRRSRVVRIFPNRASCLRPASALLKEWHQDWVTGRRCLRMEALAGWDAAGSDKTGRSLGEAA